MAHEPLYITNKNARYDWKAGEICYYWQFDAVHKAVFCRWTVGKHVWAAVFDISPEPKASDSDGYDYATCRVTADMLFDNKQELVELATKAYHDQIATEEKVK